MTHNVDSMNMGDSQKADNAERGRRLGEELKNHIEHCIGQKLPNQAEFIGRFSRQWAGYGSAIFPNNFKHIVCSSSSKGELDS